MSRFSAGFCLALLHPASANANDVQKLLNACGTFPATVSTRRRHRHGGHGRPAATVGGTLRDAIIIGFSARWLRSADR